MKNCMLLLLLLSGCAPPTHKAQDAITAYLRKNVKDPNSYVPISFGEPRAMAARADTALIFHVYQQKKGADSTTIYSNLFKVDSLSGYAKLVKP